MKRAAFVRATCASIVVLTTGGLVARALLEGPTPTHRSRTMVESVTAQPDVVVVRPGPLVGLTVSNVTGPVERRTRPGEPWRPVRPGEVIHRNESLRTGSGGAAVLELQDHTTIWLWPESEVSAERIDDELARLGVAGGRLDLNVPVRRERSVEVAAEGGATAVTRGARFSIIVDGAHVATVATREGEVEVVSGTGRVRVPPGMQTRARPGQPPEVVEPIPTELLLAVDWPSTTLRSRTAIVRGRAPVGVLVSVGGTRVVVADDGTFEHTVTLSEGQNRLEVTAEDVMGRRVTRRSPPLRVDTRPPSVGARGRWE